MLTEFFIRNGNDRIALVLEKGGRGEFGGSDREIDRAARQGLFLISTIQGDPDKAVKAWMYAESLLNSPTSPSGTGGILAAFLSNKQTWPEGDSTPALMTLLQTMDDPKYGKQALTMLWFTRSAEGPPGCDKALWSEIWARVETLAAEQKWEPPPKLEK